jgi:hypothetical protein
MLSAVVPGQERKVSHRGDRRGRGWRESPEGYPVEISPALCWRAGALIGPPCTPGQPLSAPAIQMIILTDKRLVASLRVFTETSLRGTPAPGRRLCRSRAGLGSHPEARRGASRRRGIEWERPHSVSWHSAIADDAEWVSGKSRNRLAPVLTEASSWRSDQRAHPLIPLLQSEHQGE